MSKPEDIPQDVWDVAKGWANAETITSAGKPNVAHVVARAIMAERDACAQVVLDMPDAVHHPMGPAYGAGWAAAVQMLRIAILKRKEG